MNCDWNAFILSPHIDGKFTHSEQPTRHKIKHSGVIYTLAVRGPISLQNFWMADLSIVREERALDVRRRSLIAMFLLEDLDYRVRHVRKARSMHSSPVDQIGGDLGETPSF